MERYVLAKETAEACIHFSLRRVHICLSSISRNFNMFPFLLGRLVPCHARRNRRQNAPTIRQYEHQTRVWYYTLLFSPFKKIKPLFVPFALRRDQARLKLDFSPREALSSREINNRRKKGNHLRLVPSLGTRVIDRRGSFGFVDAAKEREGTKTVEREKKETKR